MIERIYQVKSNIAVVALNIIYQINESWFKGFEQNEKL